MIENQSSNHEFSAGNVCYYIHLRTSVTMLLNCKRLAVGTNEEDGANSARCSYDSFKDSKVTA